MERIRTTPLSEASSSAGAARRADSPRDLRDRLGRLTEVGRRIIDAIGAQLSALSGPDRTRRFFELEGVYDRINWALRLIVALGLKITRDAKAVDRAGMAETSSRPDPSDRPEGLDRESGDRFDLDGFASILRRPIEEVAVIICEALGATPEWRRWADAAWRGEEVADDAGEASATAALSCRRWSRRPQARLARSLALGPVGRAAPS